MTIKVLNHPFIFIISLPQYGQRSEHNSIIKKSKMQLMTLLTVIFTRGINVGIILEIQFRKYCPTGFYRFPQFEIKLFPDRYYYP